jgi:hypothetical protein
MSFNLVQRLESAPDGQSQNYHFGADTKVSDVLLGADAQVELAKMGRIEFGFSIPADSGNRIVRAASDLKIVTQTLVRPTYQEDVHFVCTDEQAEETVPEWHAWTEEPIALEPTFYFRDNRDESPAKYGKKVVGWWALKEDLIWTREESVASNILKAFQKLGS